MPFDKLSSLLDGNGNRLGFGSYPPLHMNDYIIKSIYMWCPLLTMTLE